VYAKETYQMRIQDWVRSDSNNGYVCQMNFYTGKQEGGATEVGLGAKVVTRLTRDLVGQNHSVYMDNFFSSIDLFRNLLTDKIYATGTLCSNHRGFPADLTTVMKRGLPSRGNYECRQKRNVVVTVWQDTNPS